MRKPLLINEKARLTGRGFSLLELLVVIVIITILMTMGAMGIRNLTGGKSTSTAIANAEAVFAEARATAIGKGTSTRVIVDADDINDQSKYLRKILVAAQDLNEDGTPKTTWTLSSRGYTLPDGTFYSAKFSKKSATGNEPMTPEQLTFTKASDSGKYVVYEFNNQGICKTPGATFVIGAGARPKGQEPIISGAAKRDFAGFTIWGNGETSTFRNTTQIGDLTAVKNF